MFFFFLGAREAFDSPELERFARALDTAQTRYPGMTVAMLTALLRIGMMPSREGDVVSISDIVARSPGHKYPTVARQIDLLGDGNDRSPGLGLIEKQTDERDRRIRYVAISERGRQLLYELDLVLAPSLLDRVSGTAADQ